MRPMWSKSAEGGELCGAGFYVEQSLGAWIGQHDLAELIDRNHRIDQAGQDFAKLIAFGRNASKANVGRGPSHFELFGALGIIGQPLANPLAQIAPYAVFLADGNGVERILIIQVNRSQTAQS